MGRRKSVPAWLDAELVPEAHGRAARSTVDLPEPESSDDAQIFAPEGKVDHTPIPRWE